MRDDSQLEQVTGAVGLGLFASDVVLGLGRLMHGVDGLSENDRQNLEQAQDLLVGLSASADAAYAPPPGLQKLTKSGTAMDALTAVETEAAEQDVADFLAPLADALKDALQGKVEGHTQALASLRKLFSAIGDAEVAHLSRLSRPSAPSLPLWQTSAASSNF